MPAIVLKNLTKIFNGTKAVDNLSLEVEEGEVFGFLGPNGAGKTTTLRMLLGLALPTSGEAFVLGRNIRKDKGYLHHVGFLPDVPAFYNWMTAREYLFFCGKIFGITGNELIKRTDETLRMVDLQAENKRIGGFSRGMRQRLGLAQALINKPQVVFLDEPTSALDPIGRKEVLESIEAFKEHVTVFFSTHILADVERVCSRMAILNRGRMIAEGDIKSLRREYGGRTLQIEVTSAKAGFIATLQEADWVEGLEQDADLLTITSSDLEAAYREIPAILAAQEVGLRRMQTVEPDLENIFVRLVGDDVA